MTQNKTTSNTNALPPIILLPGVGGSKMDAVNKYTGERIRAWANSSRIPKSSAESTA